MAKSFRELRAQMSPESQDRSRKKAVSMKNEMPLYELRKARGLSQAMLAEILRVKQPAVAKMERRADMYLSTLRSHIEAMGGKLEVTAVFPDGSVHIRQLQDLADSSGAEATYS